MKKAIVMLFAIWMIAATQSAATAQTAANAINVNFTTQIGDSISYSAFELAEIIFIGQSPSDDVADIILDEFEVEFPEDSGEESPAIMVLQYADDEFICLQHNEDGDIISIYMRTIENGWIECNPQQENILWKLSLLTMFSENLFNK